MTGKEGCRDVSTTAREHGEMHGTPQQTRLTQKPCKNCEHPPSSHTSEHVHYALISLLIL